MKIGFIGLGNMANAMIGGNSCKMLYTKDELIGSSKTEATAERIHEKYGIKHARIMRRLPKRQMLLYWQ